MEFLVNIEVGWPADGDPGELARLTAAERAERKTCLNEMLKDQDPAVQKEAKEKLAEAEKEER